MDEIYGGPTMGLWCPDAKMECRDCGHSSDRRGDVTSAASDSFVSL